MKDLGLLVGWLSMLHTCFSDRVCGFARGEVLQSHNMKHKGCKGEAAGRLRAELGPVGCGQCGARS